MLHFNGTVTVVTQAQVYEGDVLGFSIVIVLSIAIVNVLVIVSIVELWFFKFTVNVYVQFGLLGKEIESKLLVDNDGVVSGIMVSEVHLTNEYVYQLRNSSG